MAKLTEIQNQFIKELFNDSLGDVKEAAKKVLGTEDYSSLLTDELIAEIQKRSEVEIALQAPKAIHTLSQMLKNPEGSFFIDKLSKVAQDILDRAGVSKKEAKQSSQMTIGVVLLPSKTVLAEPPAIEQGKTIEGPVLLSSPVIINDLLPQS